MGTFNSYINNLAIDRLDRMTNFGERNEALPMSRIGPMPGVILTDTDRWAIDLGQRAAIQRASIPDVPRGSRSSAPLECLLILTLLVGAIAGRACSAAHQRRGIEPATSHRQAPTIPDLDRQPLPRPDRPPPGTGIGGVLPATSILV